ncbi:hypothetical protein GCM10010377_73450 [Streptomyces viridiviolaceus]|nr:hypothetical protein GCM10010377_73450 [Streptomyces viridiviolaceus]
MPCAVRRVRARSILQRASLARCTEAEGVSASAGGEAAPLEFRLPYDISAYAPGGPGGCDARLPAIGRFAVIDEHLYCGGMNGETF